MKRYGDFIGLLLWPVPRSFPAIFASSLRILFTPLQEPRARIASQSSVIYTSLHTCSSCVKREAQSHDFGKGSWHADQASARV